MSVPREIHTVRLLLRRWRSEDREPFAKLNADPVVMEHFPSTLTRQQSDALAERIEAHFLRHDFGLWAVEIPPVTPFGGFLGLSVPTFQAHFTPCVEIGWRLAKIHWGMGYATEGARAALNFGFEQLGLNEIVSFTVPANVRSRKVMERIGMSYSPADDFDHPTIVEGHPRRHVLYRMTRRNEQVGMRVPDIRFAIRPHPLNPDTHRFLNEFRLQRDKINWACAYRFSNSGIRQIETEISPRRLRVTAAREGFAHLKDVLRGTREVN